MLERRLADLGIRLAVSLSLGEARCLSVNPNDPAFGLIRLVKRLSGGRTVCCLSIGATKGLVGVIPGGIVVEDRAGIDKRIYL